MVTTEGEGVLLFWPSLGGPVGGVNVKPCIFAGTATQAMRQRKKKWTGPACNNLQVPEKKKSRGKGKYPQDLPYADGTNVECILNLSLST